MAIDNFANFVVFDVPGAYADVDTAIVVDIAAVTLCPAAYPFYLVWWDAATYTTPTADPNREIIRVDNLLDNGADATLTVIRGQKSTSASAKAVDSKMLLSILADQIVPKTGANYRVKADGTLQFYNVDQSLYHTFSIRGTAGDEYPVIGAGEA